MKTIDVNSLQMIDLLPLNREDLTMQYVVPFPPPCRCFFAPPLTVDLDEAQE